MAAAPGKTLVYVVFNALLFTSMPIFPMTDPPPSCSHTACPLLTSVCGYLPTCVYTITDSTTQPPVELAASLGPP